MSKTGRPPILHEGSRREVCALLCAGCSLRAAARYIGCAPSTISRTSQVDPRFASEIRRAYMRRELTLLHNIRHAGTTSWRASAWLLERLYPDRYGRRGLSRATGLPPVGGMGVPPMSRSTGILPVHPGPSPAPDSAPTVGWDQRSAGPPSASPPPRNSLEAILNTVPVEYRDALAQRLQEANYEQGIDDYIEDDHEDFELSLGGEHIDDRALSDDPRGTGVLSSSSSSSPSPCEAGKPDLLSSSSPSPSQAEKPDLPDDSSSSSASPSQAGKPDLPFLLGLLLLIAVLAFAHAAFRHAPSPLATQQAVASLARQGDQATGRHGDQADAVTPQHPSATSASSVVYSRFTDPTPLRLFEQNRDTYPHRCSKSVGLACRAGP